MTRSFLSKDVSLKCSKSAESKSRLCFSWKKELSKLDGETTEMVIGYIKDNIDHLTLNEFGLKNVSLLTKKYDLADILESVDLSATKYLRYGIDGKPTQESAEEFINKISGILVNKNKSPVDQKISYINGICRNRFSYWNPRAGAIILTNYIKALRDFGWEEKKILDDLETELMPIAKEASNWSEWKGHVEKWTEDIKGWDKDSANNYKCEVGEGEPLDTADLLARERYNIIPALEYIGQVFGNYKQGELIKYIDAILLNYLTELEEYYSNQPEEREESPTSYNAAHNSRLLAMFGPVNSQLTYWLNSAVICIIKEFLEPVESYQEADAKPEDFHAIANKYNELIAQPNEKSE